MLNIFLIFPVDARMFLIQHCPGTRLLSPDDKMLTIIGDKTLGLAMARCVYWAKDLSVSGPMISDCSQYLHSQVQ